MFRLLLFQVPFLSLLRTRTVVFDMRVCECVSNEIPHTVYKHTHISLQGRVWRSEWWISSITSFVGKDDQTIFLLSVCLNLNKHAYFFLALNYTTNVSISCRCLITRNLGIFH